MDLGINNGLFINTPDGVHNGIYTGTNNGVFNGVFNENLITNGIVRDNLSLNLDFANYYCYQQSGTVINDLDFRYTSTLNNVSFSNVYKGNLVFNGVNSYVNNVTTYSPFGTSQTASYSYEIVFKVNSLPGVNGGSLGGSSATATPFFVDISDLGLLRTYAQNAVPRYFSVIPIQVNKIYHFICTRTGNAQESNYINSNFINSRTFATAPGMSGFRWLGGDSIGFYLNCNIYLVRAYTRVLTQSEINQNFNATKSRFNL